MTDFNLSDKIKDEMGNFHFCEVEDIREFIRLLKEELKIRGYGDWYRKKIDKLAGEALTEEVKDGA